MRADVFLVEGGHAATRSQAQRLIAAGVQWRLAATLPWQKVAKNGDDIPAGAEVQLLDAAEAKFISRGGLKLEGALAAADDGNPRAAAGAHDAARAHARLVPFRSRRGAMAAGAVAAPGSAFPRRSAHLRHFHGGGRGAAGARGRVKAARAGRSAGSAMPRATGGAARKVFASGHGTFCAALRFIVQEGDSAP